MNFLMRLANFASNSIVQLQRYKIGGDMLQKRVLHVLFQQAGLRKKTFNPLNFINQKQSVFAKQFSVSSRIMSYTIVERGSPYTTDYRVYICKCFSREVTALNLNTDNNTSQLIPIPQTIKMDRFHLCTTSLWWWMPRRRSSTWQWRFQDGQMRKWKYDKTHCCLTTNMQCNVFRLQ